MEKLSGTRSEKGVREMSRAVSERDQMEVEKMAEGLLYEWWYAIAEEIFERVCKVTELDEEQKEALREVALRPNDFQIEIEGRTE